MLTIFSPFCEQCEMHLFKLQQRDVAERFAGRDKRRRRIMREAYKYESQEKLLEAKYKLKEKELRQYMKEKEEQEAGKKDGLPLVPNLETVPAAPLPLTTKTVLDPLARRGLIPKKPEDLDKAIAEQRVKLKEVESLLEQVREKIKEETGEVPLLHYLISAQWVKRWMAWFSDDDPTTPEPGPVDNSSLLDEDETFLKSKENETDFYLFSEKIWRHLILVFGGGPAITTTVEPDKSGHLRYAAVAKQR